MVNRRSLILSTLAFCAASAANLLLLCRKSANAAKARVFPLSQWQWRMGEVGKEIEEHLKRVLGRCDIGSGIGTVVQEPHCHNVFRVWVDMDDHKLMSLPKSEVGDEFQMRYYGIKVPVMCILTYPEDDLVDGMQKAIAAGRSCPQIQLWKDMLALDSTDGMIDLMDHLVDWSESNVSGKAIDNVEEAF